MVTALDMVNEQSTPVEREGFAWVELMISGQATKDDLEAIERWRSQSPQHQQAFALAVRLRRAITLPEVEPSKPYITPFLQRQTTRRGGLVACVTTFALAGYGLQRPPLGLWPSLTELTSDYRTGTAERRAVALADGVKLEMNARTSVALRTEHGQPGIELISGEVAVATQLSKPFVVFAGSNRVSAGAAEYDVRFDERGVCVTCINGTVQVASDQASVTLVAQQQVRGEAGGLGKPVTVNLLAATAWRQGRLIFHDTPLSDVVTEINRYRPGKIVLTNSVLARSRFSGDFRVDQIGKAVRQIEKVTSATATRLVGGILILS